MAATREVMNETGPRDFPSSLPFGEGDNTENAEGGRSSG